MSPPFHRVRMGPDGRTPEKAGCVLKTAGGAGEGGSRVRGGVGGMRGSRVRGSAVRWQRDGAPFGRGNSWVSFPNEPIEPFPWIQSTEARMV